MGRRRRLFQLGLGKPGPGKAVDWEMEHHLAEQVDVLVEEGWEPEDARREAERRFGELSRHRSQLVSMDRRSRLMRKSGEWRDAVRQMTGQAVRGVLRMPGLTVAVALTLGLGIGVNTVMFEVVDRLLLQPPAHIEDPGELRRILVHGTLFGGERTFPSITYPDLEDLRSIPQFRTVGAVSSIRELTMGSGLQASRVRVGLATHDFFTTLRTRPMLGRFFLAEDDRPGAEATAVLSRELWVRAFGADPSVVGRSVDIDGHRFTVLGVAPEGFTGIDLSSVDVWLAALPAEVLRRGDERFLSSRGSYWLRAVARMESDGNEEAATSQATALHLAGRAERIEAGNFDPDTYLLTAPLIEAQGPMASSTSKTALWLVGVSLVVLIIACANVANLLLARGSRRRQEIAVRLSLGAPRPRLLAEEVLTGLLLAGLGGVVALALAQTGGVVVRGALLPDIHWPETGVPGRVVGITLALSLVAGFLAGIGPAIQSTLPNLSRDLKKGGREGTRRRSSLRTLLTVTQAAMSVVLLVGAGLFVRSLGEVRSLDLGLDVDRLVLAMLEIQGEEIEDSERTRFYETALERVSQVPGVDRAALTDVPFQWYLQAELRLPGIDSLPIPRGVGPLYFSVSPGYLEALGLNVIRGRSILETDGPGAPQVAVVNETMARALWPDGEALGSCFYFNGEEECTTVVGVVENASVGDIEGSQWLSYYLPIAQTGFGPQGLYLRSEGDPEELAAAVAPILRSFSPRVRYADVQTLRQRLDPQTRSWTLGAALFTGFGLLALLVAAVGLYSVLAFEVARRTREIGVRSALGAGRGQVLREILGDGGRIAITGSAVGLVAAFLLAPLVQPLLFQVEGRDPWVLLGVSAAMLVVGSLSSLPPALRATRVDPAQVLKEE